jgi:molybdate transport system substrate-binding protein
MRFMTHQRRAIALAASIFVSAGIAHAADVNVMASMAIKEVYLELVPQFETISGRRVATNWVGSADIMKRMKAGESTDLVIVAADAIDELTNLGKIVPGSRVDLVKSGIGVAVRAGAQKPDISSGEALKRALLGAKSIAYSSGPSGTYLSGLFQRMGIADALKGKLVQAPSGTPVGGFIARGDAEIGFQQVSELLPVAGIDFVGPLPPDIQSITVFSGAVHVGATEPGAARDLLRFLASPASAPVMRRRGMEPV